MTSITVPICLVGIVTIGAVAAASGSEGAQPNNATPEGQGVETALSADASAITYWVNPEQFGDCFQRFMTRCGH